MGCFPVSGVRAALGAARKRRLGVVAEAALTYTHQPNQTYHKKGQLYGCCVSVRSHSCAALGERRWTKFR